jgi:hypothetical protein
MLQKFEIESVNMEKTHQKKTQGQIHDLVQID